MADAKAPNELIQDIKTKRDEIKVQAHLLKLESKEEWENLEKKWNQLNQEFEPTKDAAEEAADDVGTATKLLMNELATGYKNMLKALKQ